MAACAAPECVKPSHHGKFCRMHYSRLHRHGDLNMRLRAANGEGYSRRGRRVFEFTKDNRRVVQEAVVIVEKILGKKLPKGAVVHHVNENPLDNRHENLVVLQNQGMHNIVHGRTKALAATGNARAKPCRFCHQYETDVNKLKKNGTNHYHLECAAEYARSYRVNRKEKVQ